MTLGHVELEDFRVAQVTDTPGLLARPDADRNDVEMLALAALGHLPAAVLFVFDLSGLCGTPVGEQVEIYEELRARFGHKPWLTVVNKCDLTKAAEAADLPAAVSHSALRVSADTGDGLGDLDTRVRLMLEEMVAETGAVDRRSGA